MKLKEITSANVKTVRRTNIENPGESRMLNVRVSFDSQKKKKKKKKEKRRTLSPAETYFCRCSRKYVAIRERISSRQLTLIRHFSGRSSSELARENRVAFLLPDESLLMRAPERSSQAASKRRKETNGVRGHLAIFTTLEKNIIRVFLAFGDLNNWSLTRKA